MFHGVARREPGPRNTTLTATPALAHDPEMSGLRSGRRLSSCTLVVLATACGGEANDAREPVPAADTTNESPPPAAPELDDPSTPESIAEPEPSASSEEPVAPPNERAMEDDEVYMERLFDEYCVGCHAEAASVEWMIGQGWLIPGLPERSPAFQIMATPEGPHSDRPWPVEDDLLLICNYVDRGPDGSECTSQGLAELRRSLD